MKLSIITASVREGRHSDRVALYFKNYLESNHQATVEILDLKSYNFPVFEERLRFQKNPLPGVLDFTEKVVASEGILIITPEYNGGYPASLKNVLDLLYNEWHRKPIAISTVSDGVFGGSQVITSLQFVLWKMRACTVSAMFPVPSVLKTFDEKGIPTDKDFTDKRANIFVKEWLWFIEANRRMEGFV